MHRPLCVMHLLSSFETGGAETVALNLAKNLGASEFRAVACSLGGDGPMGGRLRACGIEAFAVGPAGRPAKLWRLVRLLRAQRVDVLHCHNSEPLIWGVLAGRLARTPVVLATRHAISLPAEYPRSWFVERSLARLLDQQVAVSQVVLGRGLASGRMREERSSVILNAIDTGVCRPRDGMAAEPGCPPVVGCVARFSEGKRHCDLVEAAAALVRDGNELRLDLVGDGETRPALEAQVRKLGMEGRVRFLGMRSDVPELLRGLDVFVLPSRFEGLPLTILEAMASGLPVVATRVGGVPELVEDGVNGLLVEPQKPTELAAAIRRLVEDAELRRRMGAAGRRLAIERFDLAAAARKHEELYRRLLARKGAGAEGRR